MARIGARNRPENNDANGNGGLPVNDIGGNVINPQNIVYTDAGSIEGADGTPETGTVEPVRRRGRPPGSKNGTAKATGKTVPVDVNSITFSLTGIHALLAAGLSSPELMMTEDEGKVIGTAAAAVARHYDLQASQKAIDWGNLVVALGAFYGPRIVAIRMRRKSERNERRAANAGVPVQQASAPVQRQTSAAARPSGVPLRTHTPSDDEKAAMLNETVTPMFN